MKFLRYICLIILFLPLAGNSQHLLSGNLVSNSSFEDYTSCPNIFSQICFASPWSDGKNCMGSSDYLHTCSTDFFIQNNLITNSPHTGNGCAGIFLYLNPTMFNNYREYLEVKIKNKLVTNKKYCCNFYTVLSSFASNIAIENIGIFISKNYVSSYNPNISGAMLIDSIPQINNKNGIIIDTVNWIKISGIFEAYGGEEYITLGNFDDDSHTNWVAIEPVFDAAYYLIDDVSVCECSFDINLGADSALCESEPIILNPNLPNATYTWQDSSHAATYEVKQPGIYWVRAYVADYDITSTDTIVISAGDDNICNPPLTIPNVITPNGDSQNDNFVIQNAETYEIALQIYNRWGNIIYESTSYQNDFSCNNCADGVYFYVLKAKSKRNGREKEYKGSLTVIK